MFVVSSIIHMFLGYHRSDFAEVPREGEVQAAPRPFAIPPGEYVLPRADCQKDMQTPEFQEKLNQRPVAFLTVILNGPFTMGGSLVAWFVYSVVVAVFAAYVAGQALAPGADYVKVFQFTGVTALGGYVLALWQGTIWMKRKLSTTLRSPLDGLVYALLTAGFFGWLWPGA
ncbi:MAG: hypothetical protein GY838_04345 [bacterium]|nr:hypothetical protein [bacterium]